MENVADKADSRTLEMASNIVIADESALFFHLHTDGKGKMQQKLKPAFANPLDTPAIGTKPTVNLSNPLYGNEPLRILCKRRADRRRLKGVVMRSFGDCVPHGSFWELRPGLFVASPELTVLRMAEFLTEAQLTEAITNLCGRYYLNVSTQDIEDRTTWVMTKKGLADYLASVPGSKGVQKAQKACDLAFENSGSPIETKLALSLCMPMRNGGGHLAFTCMNHDVKAGRMLRIMEQSEYCIDVVNPLLKVGCEYDSLAYHDNPEKDKRRINELLVLGWKVYPLGWDVLSDPDKTRLAMLKMAHLLKQRFRPGKNWEAAFIQLRRDLDLPV